MQQDMDNPGKTSSQILPVVVAAFAGATLAIACERPDARMAAADGAANRPRPAATAPATTPAAEAEAPKSIVAPVVPQAINDTVITARIATALLADPAMAGADVSVNTDRGVVILVGSVKSHEQTGVASAHAQRQDGVMRVDNHLSLNSQ